MGLGGGGDGVVGGRRWVRDMGGERGAIDMKERGGGNGRRCEGDRGVSYEALK